jgi:hypothetical protein
MNRSRIRAHKLMIWFVGLSALSFSTVSSSFADELLPLPSTQQVIPQYSNAQEANANQTLYDNFRQQIAGLNSDQLHQLDDGLFKLISKTTDSRQKEYYLMLLKIVHEREQALLSGIQ